MLEYSPLKYTPFAPDDEIYPFSPLLLEYTP